MKHLPLYPLPPLPPIQGVLPLAQNTACSLCRLAEGNPVGQRCLPADGRPGDILVVSDYPGEVERRLQRPMAGPAGRWLRDLFKRVAPDRNVVYANAINCHPASGVTPETLEAAALSCRGYVAKVLEECQPKLVLLMGPYAGRSFLGRSYAPLSVRTGYSWCFDLVAGEFRGIPVFFMPNPAAAVRNPLIAKAFEKDLLTNLAAAPDLRPHHTTAVYSVVETTEDAATALEMLGRAAYVATDVEASGVMFEDDYRIECLSVSDGESTFVWGRDALCDEAMAPYLDRILTELDHTSWNGQYDYCAIECESAIDARHDKPPHHPGGKLNLQSDARLKRKLYEADAAGDLATAAELVGMGGHKEENEAVVAEVCHELSKLALSTTLTPTGKVRKAPALRWVRKEEVHPRWIEKLLQGFTPKMFAHRFVPEDVEWRYNARDAYTTWHLEAWSNDRLLRFAEEEDDGLLRVWSEVTQPAMWAYCRMRINGFPIHKEYLQVFQTYLETAIEEVQKKIDAYCPGLNSESPKQVGAYLSSVGIRPSRKTESGQPSYSDDALEDYADKHPMVDLILQHRELVKQLGTYAVGLAHYVCSDGRAHPTVLQDGTDTGRSSCKEPNLFNQSKGRTARKRVLANMLRAAFVAPSGWSFIDADEGQIEIRGAAHLSGDPAMKEMLASGTDFHQQSAEKFAVAQGKDPTKVTELDRENAKCFHPDTEVLTPTGWVRIADLARSDWASSKVLQAVPSEHGQVELSWTTPLEVFTKIHPSGELLHLRNESIDLRVTPDHRMLEWLERSGNHRVVMPQQFGGFSTYWVGAGLLGDSTAAETALYRLAVAIQADGSYTGSAIRFGFSKARKSERLRALLQEACVPHTYTVRRGVHEFYLHAERCKELRSLLDADKTLPWSWLTLPLTTRLAILDEAKYWDGTALRGGRSYRYATSLEKNADVLQALAAMSGFKSRKVRSGNMWCLSIKDRARSKGGNVYRTRLDYTNEVACLSVPSSFVLVRDRGIPVVTGQTGNFAAVYEIPSELGFMLSSRLKIPRKAGEALGDAMFRTYKGLLAFMEDRYSAAWQKGYTRTHWKGQPGRRRPLWGLGSNPPTLAELQAAIAQEKQNRGGASRLDKNAARSTYNTDVQGSSVDVVASMLWRVQRWLDENTDGGQFVLHVYDSIVLLVQDKDIDKTVKFLVALMRDDAGTERYMGDIALRVDVKVGRCLGAVEKIKGV